MGKRKHKPISDDTRERYVYGIQSGRFIKIGVALNIEARLEDMRLLNPHNPTVVYYRRMIGAFHCERKMHEVLSDKAVGREWFDCSLDEVRDAGKIGIAYATKIRRQMERRHADGIGNIQTQGYETQDLSRSYSNEKTRPGGQPPKRGR